MNPPRHPIIIYRRSPGVFHVHQGECYHHMLAWDEMLGQIATLTHTQITSPRYEMLSPEGWAARRDRRREPMRFEVSTAPVLPVLEALKKIVHWNCKRGQDDKPLPLEFQMPEVQDAMRAIAAETGSAS